VDNIEKELIEKGIIDSDIITFSIEDWYTAVKISFVGNIENELVCCTFKNCFEVHFKHDNTYPKGVKFDGNNNYKYYVQDINIIKNEGFFICNISAWPFDGKIVCKDIIISTQEINN
jgi:hypothetical protein